MDEIAAARAALARFTDVYAAQSVPLDVEELAGSLCRLRVRDADDLCPIRGAIRPYFLVSCVAGLETVWAGAGIFVWPMTSGRSKAALLAVALGLGVWAVIGTVELVRMTAFHGRMRAKLPQIPAAYREARKQVMAGGE